VLLAVSLEADDDGQQQHAQDDGDNRSRLRAIT
jgi:hypothetical protein